jgi:predicted lipoprotein with Yx(FWY)xxD motif
MKKKLIIGMLLLAPVVIAACGDDTQTASPAQPIVAEDAPAAGSTVAVKAMDTLVGTILTGPDGRTLYGFTNDSEARSTCYGACAEAWPPVLVSDDWTVGPELDSGVFSTITRDDGTQQLVAGKWPLYAYSGDAAPGDINGQGSGDVWFVVGDDAKLVKNTDSAASEEPSSDDGYGYENQAPEAPTKPTNTPTTESSGDPEAAPEPEPQSASSVRVAESPLGQIVVDADGMTLYAFTKDDAGAATCVDACAKAWPASAVLGEPVTGDGVIAELTAIDAPGGGKMVKAGKWPLYRFAGDAAPGDVNGQGSGGVWFVVRPDGTLVK